MTCWNTLNLASQMKNFWKKKIKTEIFDPLRVDFFIWLATFDLLLQICIKRSSKLEVGSKERR